MVNHVRTLLLNRHGESQVPGAAGSQYVPATYKAKRLPTTLQLLHTTLFGAAPDDLFCNYRLHQIMTLLHACDLADYVTATDARLTYLPLDNMQFADIFQQTCVGDLSLVLAGTTTANETYGYCRFAYKLRIFDEQDLQIDQLTPWHSSIRVPYGLTAGLSQQISLPGTPMTVRLQSPIVGQTCKLHVNARPTTDFGIVLQRFAAVFHGVSDALLPPTTPLRVFRDVWHDHVESPNRYAAAILTLAAAIDNLAYTD